MTTHASAHHEALAQLRASLLREAAQWTNDDLADVQYACEQAAAEARAIRGKREAPPRLSTTDNMEPE